MVTINNVKLSPGQFTGQGKANQKRVDRNACGNWWGAVGEVRRVGESGGQCDCENAVCPCVKLLKNKITNHKCQLFGLRVKTKYI